MVGSFRRIADHLKNKRNNLFVGDATKLLAAQRRPVLTLLEPPRITLTLVLFFSMLQLLILVDRNMDIYSIMEHTWTYQVCR